MDDLKGMLKSLLDNAQNNYNKAVISDDPKNITTLCYWEGFADAIAEVMLHAKIV